MNRILRTRIRTWAAFPFGLVAWYAVVVAADYVLVTQAGLTTGLRFAILGLIELAFGGAVVVLALRMAGLKLANVGLTTMHAGADLLIGFGVAVAFAALQFLVIIPATGGATRSDIVANAAQIGDTLPGLLGFFVLAVFGSTSEELLFRGLLLGGLAIVAGGGVGARPVATILVVVLFALGHGYQGWAGIVDTGLYGGLLLSLLYWWRGARLAAPIAAHMGWNAIASTLVFLQVLQG
jgi:hypothetical protein